MIRALLDPIAEATSISEAVAKTLNLPCRVVNVNVQGVQACSAGTSDQKVAFTLNLLSDPQLFINLHALVLAKLTVLILATLVVTES